MSNNNNINEKKFLIEINNFINSEKFKTCKNIRFKKYDLREPIEHEEFLSIRYYISKLINIATENNFNQSLDILIEKINDKESIKNLILFLIEKNNHKALSLYNKTRYSFKNINLLIFSAKSNNVDMVKMLLKNKIFNPAEEDNFLISWATQENHTQIVKLLLKDPRVNPKNVLTYSIFTATREIIQLLLKDQRIFNPLRKKLISLKEKEMIDLFKEEYSCLYNEIKKMETQNNISYF